MSQHPSRPAVRRFSTALLLAVLAAAPALAWERVDLGDGRYAVLDVPASLAAPAPAIVFLHGSGSSPEAWKPLLAGLAADLGAVLVMPHAASSLGWGIGDDQSTIRLALDAADARVPLDRQRIGIAGHSSGGGYALVLGYAGTMPWSGVFALGAPYRTVLATGDPDYVPPARLYYGTADPNYQGGSYTANAAMLAALGVAVDPRVAAGYGHSGPFPDGTLRDGFAFLLAHRHATAGGCVPSATRLCLLDGRYAVEASWATAQESGEAHAVVARERDSGLFWFFAPTNWELTVKVLDGCALNGQVWVFAGGLTDVAHTLRVTEIASGRTKTWERPHGLLAPLADTSAFACP